MNIKFARPDTKKQSNYLDLTKNSNQFKTKGCISMSDVNKLYRKEEIFKKKFKNIVQTNTYLENKIKNYQTSIKQERSAINFQLGQLYKTMMSKVSTFVQERIDKDKFKTNEIGLETIKQMMVQFQEVEKQSKVNKKVQQQLQNINLHYKDYSNEIDQLVKLTQTSNKEYQTSIKGMMSEKVNQINTKKQTNEDIFDSTQTLIKNIDQYQNQKNNLIQEQKVLQKYIQKLKKIQADQQKEVDKFKKWAQIVIDKNHRKVFYKENSQKEKELQKLKQNNLRMEVYLNQLEQEERALKRQNFKNNQKQNLVPFSKQIKSKKSEKSQVKLKPESKTNSNNQSLKQSKMTKTISSEQK